jgi:hypothetical protein
MKKTLITAAALAMSASVAGIAYAAAPSATPASVDRAVVVPAPSTDDPAGDRGRGRDHAEDDLSPTTMPTLEHPAGDDRGMDDPATHDVGDDHGGATRGRGADDSGPGSTNSGRVGDDDPAGHDAGDDHGSGRHGADDPTTHDAGDDHGRDDHGSGGHGADD